ncbi:molybdopterin-dependent oxidoreductase [Rhodocytophaga aerolata]|uniref:Molybdopterin-dependent oxidoreductase n=2 Tax=Rhodocytophaga aerolata TaxID=455078 RepID=A0ABT8RKA9_9BACT|nr:molybdopterin cofactor-binding domain-containing protein [Rhodocytophaga aerolata]MDO1451495.1 molybdopterin-dependent oxidoreductase [Rhodocytophaga aerolata]
MKASALAGGGLLLQFNGFSASGTNETKGVRDELSEGVPVNAFLKISPRNEVYFRVTKHEMGQGVATGLAMILAEELDVDWQKVNLEFADADLKTYQSKGGHGTGGSTTIKDMWPILQQMGAAARHMLMQAAAEHWQVELSQITTDKGELINKKNEARLTYGDIADKASKYKAPQNIVPKASANYRLIGKPLTNKIIPDVVKGTYQYGMDIEVPGMLYTIIVRCPVFRGKLKKYDASKTMAVKGVKKVLSTAKIGGISGGMPYHIREGVAVLADSFWAAKKGADQLMVEWEEGQKAKQSIEDLEVHMQEQSLQESQPTGYMGNPDAFANVADINSIISAEYAYPYQLHAPMETLNCTARYTTNACEIWLGTQGPSYIAGEVNKLLGIPQENITIHLLPSGGGFGRRYYPDVAIEAIYLSKEAGGIPIKLIYTREQDFTQNMVHPYSFMRYQVGINEAKQVATWYIKEMRTYTWGATFPYRPELPWIGYNIPNIRFDFKHIEAESLLQSCAWRAVLANGWAFGQECFLDEVAYNLKKDPYEFRKELLEEDKETDIGHSNKISTKRLRQVMELAVSKTDLRAPKKEGKGKGLSVYPYMHGNSYCAQVAEVTVSEGNLSIDKIICAVDCGKLINPDLVKSQIEGGILWGLSALLHGGVEVKNGRVQRTNFHQNKIMRHAECPQIEVYFVASEEGPYGVGELSPPAAVPAVINAYFQATGKRIRKLPIKKEDNL